MEGYCPYCDALLEVGAYQETVTAKEGEAIFLMNFNAGVLQSWESSRREIKTSFHLLPRNHEGRIPETSAVFEKGYKTGVVQMSRRKELSHKGLRPDRNSLFPERIFAELWERKNKRVPYINFGRTLLEGILNTEPHDINGLGLYWPKTSPVSQRDADVAATVIQWLGTCCGSVFLAEAQKLIKEEENRLSEEFNKKFNQV